MSRRWRTGLVVTAGLLGTAGCNGTARPMLFHRNAPEPGPCPPGVEVPVNEGPILGDMPAMTPGMTVTPGAMPPGAVTIPGPEVGVPSVPAAPPAASPPVGPPPRIAPSSNPAKPTT